jgi:hypothetical protein
MDPLRLNLTTTCHGCRKENARWSLTVGRDLSTGSLETREPEYSVLFCPVCDRITPEDLEVTDVRIIVLPQSSANPGQLVSFAGAANYRAIMGPDRPFRQRDSKTMRRRYKMDGTEYKDAS